MDKMTQELQTIRVKIAEMSLVVSRMYSSAIEALRSHDIELALQVVDQDRIVDGLDLEIDEMCLRILALYSPKAAELRYVVAILRMIIDIERIGDNSKVIAKQVKNHHCAPLIAKLDQFNEIAEASSKMLNESVDLFFSGDVSKYDDTVRTAKEVGKIQKQLNKNLIVLITEDKGNAEAVMALVNVVRRMERISDHAKNIAELVPYVATGEMMRHRKSFKKDTDETDITD